MGLDIGGVDAFKRKFSQGTSPSAGPDGVSGNPRGQTYKIAAYFCTDPSFQMLE